MVVPEAGIADALAARVLACVRSAKMLGAGVNMVGVVACLGDMDLHYERQYKTFATTWPVASAVERRIGPMVVPVESHM